MIQEMQLPDMNLERAQNRDEAMSLPHLVFITKCKNYTPMGFPLYRRVVGPLFPL